MRKLLILFSCMVAAVSTVAQANYEQALRFEKEFNEFEYRFSIVPHFINGSEYFWFRHKDGGGYEVLYR